MGTVRSTIKCSTLFCNAPAGKGNRDQQQQQQMQQLLQIVACHFHTTFFFLSLSLSLLLLLHFHFVWYVAQKTQTKISNCCNFQLLFWNWCVLKDETFMLEFLAHTLSHTHTHTYRNTRCLRLGRNWTWCVVACADNMCTAKLECVLNVHWVFFGRNSAVKWGVQGIPKVLQSCRVEAFRHRTQVNSNNFNAR